MNKIIGIDLGTTKSCVAVMEDGNPTVIPTDGGRTMPSIIAFLENGEIAVGERAKGQAILNPLRTVMNIKRFMGKKRSEVLQEIQNNSYLVKQDNLDNVCIAIQDNLYKPQEISAIILQKLKRVAEAHLGHSVTDAVITVPAYFNDAQRHATKEAAEIAGLKVRRILSEPTAAALAYGLNIFLPQLIAVFDLGGGTFDISVLEFDDGIFQVKSTNGDTHLGGNDFDKPIMDWIAETFLAAEGIDLRLDPVAWQRLKTCAEQGKIELSSSAETEIDLPYIATNETGVKHLKQILSRVQFETLAAPVIQKCITLCKAAIKDSGISIRDINQLIIVGESSRIPLVLRMVGEFFGRRPIFSVDLAEAVAIGAAIQGSILNQESPEILLLDVTPLSLGIETVGGKMTVLIKKNSLLPVNKKEVFSTAVDDCLAKHANSQENPNFRKIQD